MYRVMYNQKKARVVMIPDEVASRTGSIIRDIKGHLMMTEV